jgi:hypothetical protein
MATTKTQRAQAPVAASSKAVTTRRRRTPPSPAPAVRKTVAEEAPEGRTELSEQWLELARVTETTAIETVRKLVDMVEKLPVDVAEELVDLLGDLARVEYGLLRTAVRTAVGTAVDVNLNTDVDVNVDVLSKGVHTDILSGGVHVDTLSRN